MDSWMTRTSLSFHSTDFPYERGPDITLSSAPRLRGFHSTDFPYERGPLQKKIDLLTQQKSFHSTDFPYERGPDVKKALASKTETVLLFPFN